jgi:hypothetical protein
MPWGPDRLRFEIQVETPQSILGPDGTALVARMIRAAQGRCTGLHYGTYDYSAFCGIAAGDQSLEHPVGAPLQVRGTAVVRRETPDLPTAPPESSPRRAIGAPLRRDTTPAESGRRRRPDAP